jgi:hypothetical protein
VFISDPNLSSTSDITFLVRSRNNACNFHFCYDTFARWKWLMFPLMTIKRVTYNVKHG